MEGAQQHWDAAYSDGDGQRSWYQTHATTSLSLIQEDGSASDRVLDVGGGSSSLASDLLAAGYTDIAVLDVSSAGMELARQRLGTNADRVTWIAGNILTQTLSGTYDVWHDRAVLHFLTEPEELDSYRKALTAGTHPGSKLVIGAFGPNGPSECSGLRVRRYNEDLLHELLDEDFTINRVFLQDHTTLQGVTQQFIWCQATRTS